MSDPEIPTMKHALQFQHAIVSLTKQAEKGISSEIEFAALLAIATGIAMLLTLEISRQETP